VLGIQDAEPPGLLRPLQSRLRFDRQPEHGFDVTRSRGVTVAGLAGTVAGVLAHGFEQAVPAPPRVILVVKDQAFVHQRQEEVEDPAGFQNGGKTLGRSVLLAQKARGEPRGVGGLDVLGDALA
jgi:hypothetical protein